MSNSNKENQERAWINSNIELKKNVAEIDGSKLPLGIFIDDEDIFAESWEMCFRIPGFSTLRPSIPDFLDRDTREQITEGIFRFIQNVTDDQLKRTAVVVVDQFADNLKLRNGIRDFISRLREVNNQAYILETSGYTDGLMYPGSNAYLTNLVSTGNARPLINLSPELPSARIQAFQFYSNPSFIQAGLADPSYAERTGRDEFSSQSSRSLSFNKLISSDEFEVVLNYLNLDSDALLYKIFNSFSPLEQKLILHYCWNIVGHIQIGSGVEYFGGSIARIKELLQK